MDSTFENMHKYVALYHYLPNVLIDLVLCEDPAFTFVLPEFHIALTLSVNGLSVNYNLSHYHICISTSICICWKLEAIGI